MLLYCLQNIILIFKHNKLSIDFVSTKYPKVAFLGYVKPLEKYLGILVPKQMSFSREEIT